MDLNYNKNSLITRINELITTPLKIRVENINCHFLETFQKCITCNYLEKSLIYEIDCVLDYLHEELNTGHWSKIPITTRENFTIASFIKCSLTLQQTDLSEDLLIKCLKTVDLGLLLGAPLNENEELLTETAQILQQELNLLKVADTVPENTTLKKRKTEYNKENFIKLTGKEIEELEIPSIETFNKEYFSKQIPIKLKGCMSHWPASKKWLDVNYLIKLARNRTVPIEIGSRYTDEDWSQKLMTLKDFIIKHYLSETGDVGYLAQHNLFDQIHELKEDIRIPEYCCCSSNYEDFSEPDINAWFGPKGTISPLHQDPKNNILAQVYGTKQVILYSTKDTPLVYPHEEMMLSNTAQVDPINPNFEIHPLFREAEMFKCLLEPGEMLFIPIKWWHHVTALEKSFSVSFWWQ